MKKSEGRPLVFDIHHFALDDGPGIRTTVFLKGCPLTCIWCHNPESIRADAEIGFYQERCVGCDHCKEICPRDAISSENADRVIRDRCNSCGRCTDECPSEALKTIGKYISPDALVEILLRDKVLYDTSGGGVTFSGGEPTVYMDYVRQVIEPLKERNVHIAIQTSGMFDLSEFNAKLLPYIDMIYFDLKMYSPIEHKVYTGRTNSRILSNFTALCGVKSVDMAATIPLIPGITAATDNLTGILAFLKSAGCSAYELKPYHPGGIQKRKMIGGQASPEISEIPMSIEEQLKIENFLELSSYYKRDLS